MSFLMFQTISFDMEWPLNPYAIGICGGIPGFNILSLSGATKANISAASTRRKLKPSSTKSADCKLFPGNHCPGILRCLFSLDPCNNGRH